MEQQASYDLLHKNMQLPNALLTLSEASSTLHLDNFHRATDTSIFSSFQRLKFKNVKILIEETLILSLNEYKILNISCTILKFITTIQSSIILKIQTKCFNTNCNNPAFQSQDNNNFVF